MENPVTRQFQIFMSVNIDFNGRRTTATMVCELMIRDAGETLFSRVRNLEAELGIHRLYLKFEGSNPTGTQKDRIAQIQYEDAHARGFKVMTVATCGNYGAAVAYACSANGIRPAIFVPADYHTVRVVEMERAGARVIRVPGAYEDAVEASRVAAVENGWYDANPGAENAWELSRRGYGRIAREIADALGRMPDTVSVSVGNGTTLAGVFDGFKEIAREWAGEPFADGAERPGPRLPRMVAASTPRGNPIIKSFKSGLAACADLDPIEIRETEINEPLTNWHAYDGDRALDALRASRGFAEYASDASMRRMTALIRQHEGINVLTASTAALAGLARVVERERLAGREIGDTHVIVLTGRSISKPRATQAQTAVARAPVPWADALPQLSKGRPPENRGP